MTDTDVAHRIRDQDADGLRAMLAEQGMHITCLETEIEGLRKTTANAWRAGWNAYREAFDHYDDPSALAKQSMLAREAAYLAALKEDGT